MRFNVFVWIQGGAVRVIFVFVHKNKIDLKKKKKNAVSMKVVQKINLGSGLSSFDMLRVVTGAHVLLVSLKSGFNRFQNMLSTSYLN